MAKKNKFGSSTNKNVRDTSYSENITDEWIKRLRISAFIDKKYKRHVDDSILNPLPLLKFDNQIWQKLFVLPPDGKYEKLQLTNVGTYSIGQPDINKELIDFVKEMVSDAKLNPDTLRITETNGGLGGFSSALLREFNILNITELNPTHFSIIKNNLEVYGFGKNSAKKITIYNEDYLDIMLTLEQDVIISDPPWGGKEYAKKPAIQLGFSNIDITEVINFLNMQKRFKLFIFLAPKNYNFNAFISDINTKNITIRKVRRHNFVCVAAS